MQVEQEDISEHPSQLRMNTEIFRASYWLRQGGDHVLNLSNYVTFLTEGF